MIVSLVLLTTAAQAQSRTRRPRTPSPRARIAALEASLVEANARAESATTSAAEATARAEEATARAERAERRAAEAETAARDADARAARAEARAARGRRSEPAATPATPRETPSAPHSVVVPSPASPTEAGALPSGRGIANLSADACLAVLRAKGVSFDALAAEDAIGVRTPVRVLGPIGGVTIAPRNDPSRSPHAIVDCRLALAVLVWAPTLRAAHIAKIEHYSAFRANARIGGAGATSAHASAMALDAALFHTDDGQVLDVLVDWADRTRGADPCTPRDGEPARSHILRSVVCEAVRADLFQVVLTPHHDAAHQNHVHLELRPGVTWSFVH